MNHSDADGQGRQQTRTYIHPHRSSVAISLTAAFKRAALSLLVYWHRLSFHSTSPRLLSAVHSNSRCAVGVTPSAYC